MGWKELEMEVFGVMEKWRMEARILEESTAGFRERIMGGRERSSLLGFKHGCQGDLGWKFARIREAEARKVGG